jgi:HSP20 family molecular chaperone IbpA
MKLREEVELQVPGWKLKFEVEVEVEVEPLSVSARRRSRLVKSRFLETSMYNSQRSKQLRN